MAAIFDSVVRRFQPDDTWVMASELRPQWKYNSVTAALARAVYERRCRGLERTVFVATTGRSGTMTFAHICDQLDDVVALHEPHPIMNREVLQLANAGDWDPVRRYYDCIKSVNIRRAAGGARYYVEANHLFIKTFADLALADLGRRVAVVHLVRPPEQVARSMYQIRESEIGSAEGNGWWLDIRAPTNLIDLRVELADDGEYAHPYYRMLWYWYEIEARIDAWRYRNPHVPFAELATEDLSDPVALGAALDAVGLEHDSTQLGEACGLSLHQKAEEKARAPLESEVADAMHRRFLDLLDAKGHSPPLHGAGGEAPGCS